MSAAFKGRREDLRLVTGQGRYTADWDLPGQAYGHFLRADRAHAEIVSLDTSAAAASPGVLAVFTGEDLERAGFKSPRPLMFFKGKNGTELKNPHRPALAHGRIRFVGEAVALVIAETETQAQDARREADRRVSRSAGDGRSARCARTAALPCCTPTRPAISRWTTSTATRPRPTRPSPRRTCIVRTEVHAQRIAGVPMEPRSALASLRPRIGTFRHLHADPGHGRYPEGVRPCHRAAVR